MITKFSIDESAATAEFGMSCQRLVPWSTGAEEPPLGVMACFLPAGNESIQDCHDQDEVMLVLSGSGEVVIGPDRAGIRTGELIVIPRNQPHVVINPTTETLRWVSMYWPLHEPAGQAGTEDASA
ncbi:cupin domain-containing protein [Micromonospora echinofusca]|uniref:Cupin domain-containing protein n=1 Tax=Micromonospora echinofusca TaxID=47858 RepID=A0ABS3W0R1_MICEH|nr:cupin domain-containing protein [Micromonospora echinofusca]MBO4210385.1 cupin domain-containing protein [Micromonospora echinofusca]